MSTPSQTPEPWPPPWGRTTAFFVGIGLIVFEAAIEHSEHLFLYGVGFMLTGLPIARGLDQIIAYLLSRGR